MQEDVLDVLADVAGLSEGGRIGNGEGHIEQARKRLCQERLAHACGTDEENVRLLELDVLIRGGVDALVVVVDGDREHLLRRLLADHVAIEMLVDVFGGERVAVGGRGRLCGGLRGAPRFLIDDLAAEVDAFIADVDGAGAGDKAAHLVLVLATERAVVLDAIRTISGHRYFPPLALVAAA